MANKYLKWMGIFQDASNLDGIKFKFIVEIPSGCNIVSDGADTPPQATVDRWDNVTGDAIVTYKITGNYTSPATSKWVVKDAYVKLTHARNSNTNHRSFVKVTFNDGSGGPDDQDSMATSSARQGFKPKTD